MPQLRKTLTARSVVASMLLGSDPPTLPGQVLVRAGDLFGISEGTTRVALSRMVAAGELSAAGGRYTLTGSGLLRRQARQTSGRSGRTRRWNGHWLVAVVTADRRHRSARADLRDGLRQARMVELREGVWVRPDNIDVVWPDGIDEQCTTFTALDIDPAAVRDRWSLDEWAKGATELREAMRPLLAPLERGDTTVLGEGFIVSAAVLRHLQADPLLPEALLPKSWPGGRLRTDYERFDTAHRAVLRGWLRAQPWSLS